MGRDAPPAALVGLAAAVALVAEGRGVRRPVCKRCGGAEFRQYGEVEITIFREVERAVETVTIHPDGSVSAKTAPKIDLGHVRDALSDAEFGLEDEVRYHGFECAACGLAEDHINDLVVAEPAIGDRVVVDGRAVDVQDVASYRHPERAICGLRVKVEGQWLDFAQVEKWEPHPGQQALELAA